MAALGLTPQGFRALRGAVQDAKVFRAVRGAGVSLAAASGCFARCGGRPGLCPWTPEFFREKFCKSFFFWVLLDFSGFYHYHGIMIKMGRYIP